MHAMSFIPFLLIYCQVSFIEATGYKVIPPSFSANYCSGNCRYPLPNATYHAQIQAILYEKNNTQITAPCCVPVEYAPILIIVFYGGTFVLQGHDEATVTKCACR